MTREFEGKTEQEAIAKAVEELHIEREDFDVEVIDNGRHGFFRKGPVKIRVSVGDAGFDGSSDDYSYDDEPMRDSVSDEEHLHGEPESDFEKDVANFIKTLVGKMGYDADVFVDFRRDDGKLGFSIESDYSSVLIGRQGKTLDAIQLVTNVYAGNIDADSRIIVDSEGYRIRHEERLVKNAYRAAAQVKKTGRSVLLEPMNPFERRLVHTALADFSGVETNSEGEGTIKRIRIIPVR